MLYHHVTPSGVAITVQQEGTSFKWRTLGYGDEDGYGDGSSKQFQDWLKQR